MQGGRNLEQSRENTRLLLGQFCVHTIYKQVVKSSFLLYKIIQSQNNDNIIILNKKIKIGKLSLRENSSWRQQEFMFNPTEYKWVHAKGGESIYLLLSCIIIMRNASSPRTVTPCIAVNGNRWGVIYIHIYTG